MSSKRALNDPNYVQKSLNESRWKESKESKWIQMSLNKPKWA